MSLTLTSRVLRMHDSGATVLVFLPCPVTSRRSYIPSALFKTTNLKKTRFSWIVLSTVFPYLRERSCTCIQSQKHIFLHNLNHFNHLGNMIASNKSFLFNSIHQLRHDPNITTIHISSSSQALYHKNAATNIIWNYLNHKSINHKHTPHTNHHTHTTYIW